MIKLIILTNAFMCGGTEVALNSLLAKLDPKKYDITICCITKIGPLLKTIPPHVKVKQLRFSHPMYRVFVSGYKEKTDSLKMLFYKLKKKWFYIKYNQYGERNKLYERLLNETKALEEDYDMLLDFHGYGYFLSAYGANKIKAKKKAMWLHDENVFWIEKVKSYLPKYDRIFCVSNAVKDAFINCHPEYQAKTEVFYNLTDTEKIRRKAQEKIEDTSYRGTNKLLTIGRLEEQKGIDVAIKAAKILKTKRIEFCWYVIGDGNQYKKLSAQIKDNGLEDRFVLLGRRENPYPYIRDCMLYIQPSRHEGYATAVLEAKVLCKPIVASDIPSNREQIINGKNGYLCALKAESLAEQIIQLLESQEARDRVVDYLKAEKIDFSAEITKLEQFYGE